jgi:hypothetical protein
MVSILFVPANEGDPDGTIPAAKTANGLAGGGFGNSAALSLPDHKIPLPVGLAFSS